MSAVVSIIIPIHNAAAFLADALQSLRDQSLSDFTCIMIDDASTDGSRAIAERQAEEDSRFRLIAFDAPQGVSLSRTAGLNASEARWIALLDADDLYRPDRLERLIDIGEASQADMVFDDQIVTDFPATRSSMRAFGLRHERQFFTADDFFAGSRLFQRAFPLGYIKPIIRTEFLRRVGASYDPSLDNGEDFDFYAQLFAKRARCVATNYAGYIYRRRRGSLSRSDDHLHFQAKLSERVIARSEQDLSPASRAALEGRQRDFEAIAEALPALAALREKNWGKALREAIARPRVGVTLVKLARTRVLRALSKSTV